MLSGPNAFILEIWAQMQWWPKYSGQQCITINSVWPICHNAQLHSYLKCESKFQWGPNGILPIGIYRRPKCNGPQCISINSARPICYKAQMHSYLKYGPKCNEALMPYIRGPDALDHNALVLIVFSAYAIRPKCIHTRNVAQMQRVLNAILT